MRARLATLALALAATPAFGAGTNSAEFLRFGSGAPSSLSEAGGSLERGVAALYWNPAGLADSCALDAYFSHNALPETLKHDFFAVAVPLRPGGRDLGVLGYSLQVLSQGSQPEIDNTGTQVGDFTSLDQAHTLGWAGTFGPMRAGLAARFIRQSLADEAGNTAALDAGLQGKVGQWLWGAAMSNLGPGLKLGGSRLPLPLTGRIGVGHNLWKDRIELASDVSASKGADPGLHLGARVKVYGPVFIGAGYTVMKHDKDGPSGLAAGITLGVKNFRADFAFRPFGEFGSSFQLGIGYRFPCRAIK